MGGKHRGVGEAVSRAGYDTYRDCLNTPAFLNALPEEDSQVSTSDAARNTTHACWRSEERWSSASTSQGFRPARP